MKRKATKFVVIVISILLAELIHEYVQHFFHGWVQKSALGVYISVLISMAVAVAVFYPAFHMIDSYLKAASQKYIQGAKKIGKNSFIALMIGFLLALFLLFIGFSEIWYNQNPLGSVLR